MDLSKLIKTACFVVLAYAAANQLPIFIQTVRIAQLQLLKESRSSNWGRLMVLPIQK
jgi:hypothetical protein